MLRHAFEVWECFRVELKTEALNEKSRRAILRIGAKEEGTLRRHVLTWTGRFGIQFTSAFWTASGRR